MFKVFVILGSLGALLSVALGAFGAHGLKGVISGQMLANYQTGVHYQMFHALGLICVGIITRWLGPSGLLHAAGWLLLVGIILFSGSLYVLSMTGITRLGAITPIGGVSFILGWFCLILAVWKSV